MKVGVLALQGAFREQVETLDALGADVDARQDARAARGRRRDRPARAASRPRSTSCSTRPGCARRCATRSATACRRLAVCAGLIVLAAEVVDGRADQQPLGVLDVTVRRNGYGRQRESFEAPLDGARARRRRRSRACSSGRRWSNASGPGVEVLAEHDGAPVLGRDGDVSVRYVSSRARRRSPRPPALPERGELNVRSLEMAFDQAQEGCGRRGARQALRGAHPPDRDRGPHGRR